LEVVPFSVKKKKFGKTDQSHKLTYFAKSGMGHCGAHKDSSPVRYYGVLAGKHLPTLRMRAAFNLQCQAERFE